MTDYLYMPCTTCLNNCWKKRWARENVYKLNICWYDWFLREAHYTLVKIKCKFWHWLHMIPLKWNVQNKLLEWFFSSILETVTVDLWTEMWKIWAECIANCNPAAIFRAIILSTHTTMAKTKQFCQLKRLIDLREQSHCVSNGITDGEMAGTLYMWVVNYVRRRCIETTAWCCTGWVKLLGEQHHHHHKDL